MFVAFIAQVGARFARDLSWSGLAEFAVMFAMVWIAWMNGSLYHEVHGRDDGRHRAYLFTQMFLLILLAAFAHDATTTRATEFAVTYAALMGVFTFQWWVVYRIDTVPRFRRYAGLYTIQLGAIALIVLASAWSSGPARLLIWAGAIAVALVAIASNLVRAEGEAEGSPVAATESLAERFALLTIIVLGEIVVGVVNGMLEADTTAPAVAAGLLGLAVGFGFWWNYFDALGERTPRNSSRALAPWLLLHVPLHGAVVAAGVGMVTLIGHAEAGTVAPETRWLLAGSTALLLILVAALARTIDYPDRASDVLLPLQIAMFAGALLCIGIALLPVPAWLFAVLLIVVLSTTWFFAFALRTRCDPHEP